MHKVILASNSPRRKEILKQAGIKFEVLPSTKEEIITKRMPEDVVKELSALKAHDIAMQTDESAIIIGADTIVVINNQILGKPKDKKEAERMLRLLQGNTHQVYTGVTVLVRNKNEDRTDYSMKTIQFVEKTQVKVYPMNDSAIIDYITTEEPMDKAGAYAIQGKFAVYIHSINGDYYNVMGFPIGRFYYELKRQGIDILTKK